MSALLTHYEITQRLRLARKALEATTRYHVSFLTKRERAMRLLESCIDKSQKHNAKAVQLAHLPEDDEKRVKFMKVAADNQRIVSYRTHMMEQWDRHVASKEQQLRDETEEVERLEALYGAGVVPLSSQASVPMVVTVRLLSGEMLEVAVDRAHPVGAFADQFAQQHGYHPSATGRMVFLLPSYEEETKEEVQPIFWSPELRHDNKSIGDVLGQQDPLVHLLIRSVDESERKEKVPTLRKILVSLRRDDRLSDEALYDMYANWRLTADVSSLRNRYQIMLAFVEEQTEAFPVLDETGQADQARRADLCAFREFREWVKPKNIPSLSYRRTLAEHLRMWIQNIFETEGQDIVFCPSKIYRFLTALTVEELFQTGMGVQNISPQFKYYRYLAEWDRYCREAEEDTAAEE